MNRRTFFTQSCACSALILSGASPVHGETTTEKPSKNEFEHPVNPQQVMAVLTEIDKSGNAALIDAVFTRWGQQCFHTRTSLKEFAEKQRTNFQGYVDYVNSNRARYWEKLEYDPKAGLIRVTSRKFGKCPCAYAQCPKPARALCTHCCKALQVEFFQAMTGHKAEVTIEEGILLGGERCRTTVLLLGEVTKPQG